MLQFNYNMFELTDIIDGERIPLKDILVVREPTKIVRVTWGSWDGDRCKRIYFNDKDKGILVQIGEAAYPLVEVGLYVTLTAYPDEDMKNYLLAMLEIHQKPLELEIKPRIITSSVKRKPLIKRSLTMRNSKKFKSAMSFYRHSA
jgi:hypothetical protein